MLSKQSIVTAINHSQIFLKVPDLIGGQVKRNLNGIPFFYAGGFNMVFKIEKEFKVWAFRVSYVPMPSIFERYQLVSDYLQEKNLSYFADFKIDQQGLLVDGNLLDTMRMEWLEGSLLKEYIEENLHNKKVIGELATSFKIMCKELRENEISHGDLQEGNILIDNNANLRLIDYDSICIPALEGKKEFVIGLKGYQHPSRFSNSATSLKADYFSELIIYLSLLALSEDPDLWSKYQLKDTPYLLFNEFDFEDLENANIYKDLLGLSDQINILISVLQTYLQESDYRNLKPFICYIGEPTFISLKVDYPHLIKGMTCTISWEVENAQSVNIIGVGKYSPNDSIEVKPSLDTTFTLSAEGITGTMEEQVIIKVLPITIDNNFEEARPSNFIKNVDLNSFYQDLPTINFEFTQEEISFIEEPNIQNFKSDYLKNNRQRPLFSVLKIYHELREKIRKQLTS